jgi:hypothetical protein
MTKKDTPSTKITGPFIQAAAVNAFLNHDYSDFFTLPEIDSLLIHPQTDALCQFALKVHDVWVEKKRNPDRDKVASDALGHNVVTYRPFENPEDNVAVLARGIVDRIKELRAAKAGKVLINPEGLKTAADLKQLRESGKAVYYAGDNLEAAKPDWIWPDIYAKFYMLPDDPNNLAQGVAIQNFSKTSFTELIEKFRQALLELPDEQREKYPDGFGTIHRFLGETIRQIAPNSNPLDF